MPNGKSRPVIVKFVRYNTRNLVFKNKKNLKDQELENLTAKRMKKITNRKQTCQVQKIFLRVTNLF